MSNFPARLVAALAFVAAALGLQTPVIEADAAAAPASEAQALHVLNRLAYGPRPGDVADVQRIGVAAWIERQLHPDRIDDSALAARLARFETLDLDPTRIFREYHQPAQIERRERQRERAADQSQSSEATEPAASTERRLGPATDAQRKDRQIIAELEEARLLRAVHAERQLEEVLVDFWFNHFNVFAGKGPIRAYVTAFERDAIRPHVLGSFRAMLEAVAKSPAMLFYLDNWQNTSPDTGASTRRAGAMESRFGRNQQMRPRGTTMPNAPAAASARMPRGINENYARELLELHTLGVDGGYTQDDIVNVARAFTGWTMRPLQGTGFLFVEALHDRGSKTVLGHRIDAGGMGDGLEVLDVLVAHPSTARFIATKLAQKFVSDTPPPALVERAARTFTESRGDLRQVTRAIVTSPEFLAPDAYRAKVKTPLEFVASALRATGAEVRTALPLARALRDLGMPLYFCQPPTGYDETADPWVSSGALVSRMNLALEMGENRLRGITVPTLTDLRALQERLLADALGGDASDATRTTLARATTPGQMVALAIGSPEFQRQ